MSSSPPSPSLNETDNVVEQHGEEPNETSPTIPREHINKLTPPVGTVFWQHQVFTPFTNETIYNWRTRIATFTWRIDAYIYLVNALPGPQFTANGGAIYVIMVHSGSAQTATNFAEVTWYPSWPLEFQYNVSVSGTNGGSSLIQLPPSNSGSKEGDTWKYNIAYSQDFQMFRNGGNETFTFPAKYADDISFYKGEQTGAIKGAKAVRWSSILEDHYDQPKKNISFPLSALSVFRFPTTEQVKFDCTINANQPDKPDQNLVNQSTSEATITVDLRFSV